MNDNGFGEDEDVESDPLTVNVTPVVAPTHGSVTISKNGDVTYQPNADFHGTDEFRYELMDDQGATSTALVTLEVTPVNDTPEAKDDQFSAMKNKAIVGNVLDDHGSGADSDPDGDDLTVKSLSTPQHGSLTLEPDGSFVYTPNQDFLGEDQFTYSASDGQLESKCCHSDHSGG